MLRISFGKSGRMGLSMQRDESIAFSLALPSRRWKEPGIRPTAYIFSSKSTDRGKKSTPSRGFDDAVTVQSTLVSPYLAIKAAFARPAILPVSRLKGLPAMVVS